MLKTVRLLVLGMVGVIGVIAFQPDVAMATACPPWYVYHWDKIIFRIYNELPNSTGGPNMEDPDVKPITEALGLPYIPGGMLFDIKVLDDPESVAILPLKVAEFLLKKAPPGANLPAITRLLPFISIVDVDYAIVCQKPKPRPQPVM